MPPTVTPTLARVPMSLFAIVMGIGGAGIAWRRAGAALGAPPFIGEGLFLLGGVVFLIVLAAHVARAALYPRALLEEWRHPVRSNFVPASTVALAILAAGLAPYWRTGAAALWIVAAGVHVTLAFLILRRWFYGNVKTEHASPAWFIPVVGTILMPVVGVPLGFVGAGWFLFSVGFVFWVILAPLMTHRLFFAEQLGEAAVPSLFILLAPPAVGGLAVLALNGGEPNALTHVLYCFACFIMLLVASMLDRVAKTHFAIGWWALTFPTAAFASLALAYRSHVPSTATTIVAYAALAFTSAAVLVILGYTVWAASHKALIPPDAPRPPAHPAQPSADAPHVKE